MAQDNTVVIAGLVITFLTLIVDRVLAYLREKRYHEWDREERAIRTATQERATGVLARKIDENTDVSVKAFDTANNVNAKIASVAKAAATDQSARILDEISGLRKDLKK